MVDVSAKEITSRIAIASGSIHMRAETLALILEDKIEKGDVFSVARVAGIQVGLRYATPGSHSANELQITTVQLPAEMCAYPRRDGTSTSWLRMNVGLQSAESAGSVRIVSADPAVPPSRPQPSVTEPDR